MQSMFKVKPAFDEVDPYKLAINIGCLMDIPTGRYVKGLKGENILNGGLGLLTGVAGRGNTFKSTIMHYMMLSALSKVAESGYEPYANTYDTEINIDLDRLNEFASQFDVFKDSDLHALGYWNVTDKVQHSGNVWFKLLREFLKKEKIKNKKNYLVDTPFIGPEGKPLKTMFPSFGQVDSITEFDTDETEAMQDKNELGESGGNTIHMRIGLAKLRLMMELPVLANGAAHYTMLTAHVGDANNIQQGPVNAPPPKKLQHMKANEKIKGVTDKFYFLTNAFWQTVSCSVLANQATKGAEYPRTRAENDKISMDLNAVGLKMLRCKTGTSGYTLPILVSQVSGVLPTLTEFHYVKERDRFGIEGSPVNYQMVLYPKQNLGRTTVRELIDTDPKLRRAIKITADLCQIKEFYPEFPHAIPDLKEFYEKLENDYGWDLLLATRDYWTFNQYTHPVPFLSTMDLIELYYGVMKKPYFLPDGWKKGDPVKVK